MVRRCGQKPSGSGEEVSFSLCYSRITDRLNSVHVVSAMFLVHKCFFSTKTQKHTFLALKKLKRTRPQPQAQKIKDMGENIQV